MTTLEGRASQQNLELDHKLDFPQPPAIVKDAS
eukprot:CAMPEP_0180108286 /NCGR_PEP_ID=MMETSP0985-20121206/33792_1 /TAXON_ID=483367 /ORGANISM="non described non described, Strain CCMP 2436" /LENGTH=32 /DNA_ID= /DNA_START= /DNA_END= /DNA_ORIENTATION=